MSSVHYIFFAVYNDHWHICKKCILNLKQKYVKKCQENITIMALIFWYPLILFVFKFDQNILQYGQTEIFKIIIFSTSV